MLAAALIAFGNAKAWVDLVVLNSTAAGSTFGVGAGIALVLAILLGGILVRVDFSALGLSGGDWQSSLRLGVVIGGTAALAAAVLIVGGSLAARTTRTTDSRCRAGGQRSVGPVALACRAAAMGRYGHS